MKTTFDQLGIPFPLYQAPVEPEDDSDYAGAGTCCICGNRDAHCFHLGIGTALILPCPKCQTENGLSVRNKQDAQCRKCGGAIPFPDQVASKKAPKTCYACLRAGKAALSKDTEYGLVSWDQAFAGVTGGVPGLRQNQFEAVMLDAEDDWIGVRLPPTVMFELLRTPTYGTWQGASWLFCCQSPMTFLGQWDQADFDQHAADGDGARLYESVVTDLPPESWGALECGHCVYVFACRTCDKLRSHWDSD